MTHGNDECPWLNSGDNCVSEMYGHRYSGWVSEYFGECVYDPMGYVSLFVGFSSIGCWLVAQAPQLYTNFRLKTAEALSFFFLLQWFLGDATNLAGCYLSNQNATQKYTAVYFCVMDVCLCLQFFWYQIINRKSKKTTYPSKLVYSVGLLFFCCVLTSHLFVNLPPDSTLSHSHQSRLLLSHETTTTTSSHQPPDEAWEAFLGQFVGWISALLYLCSRIPQIVKNIRRKSTEGLNPLLFTMAFLGNCTYAASIFMYSLEPCYLWNRFPWLLGSVGTLCFDMTTLLQFKWYGPTRMKRKRKKLLQEEEGEEEEEEEFETQLSKPRTVFQVRKAYYARIGIGVVGFEDFIGSPMSY